MQQANDWKKGVRPPGYNEEVFREDDKENVVAMEDTTELLTGGCRMCGGNNKAEDILVFHLFINLFLQK